MSGCDANRRDDWSCGKRDFSSVANFPRWIFLFLLPGPIIQRRRRRSPLPNEIFYVRRGGRVFGSIAVDEVGFILTRRRRHKTKWSGAIFHAESSPLVIVPFPRRGAIPCVVWYISEYIASEGCFPWAPKIPPNISLCRSAALPSHCAGLRRLTERYFLTSPFRLLTGIVRPAVPSPGANKMKNPDMTVSEPERDWDLAAVALK